MIFTEDLIWPAWLCWLLPLIGAGLTPLFAKVNDKVRDYAAVLFSVLAAVMAVMLIPYAVTAEQFHNQIEWITVPGSPLLGVIKAGVIVDPLSIILANVVAIVSSLIMIYSLGYMKGENGLTRYWFFMNLFIGNMLLLVLSDNFIQMLFGWEGVGLCSYALIGFWYRDSKKDWLKCWVGEGSEAYPPSHCGMKAFITTRVGDAAMIIGMIIILAYAGTLNFLELQEGAILKVPLWLLIPAAILLIGGPVGKSAQLPLMEWLPDAMAGPTSVSALIHAATMVKAGVYLVGRLFPIIYLAAWVGGTPNSLINFFYIVAGIGVLTAFISGTQAMVSQEIKKVLAYSTVSQIGYMMIGLGVAGSTAEFVIGYTGGIFHVMSHAVFKAALFLAAGAVIHTSHSRFMRDMGGLKRHMPITFWSITLTALSLMGVPLLFSGFWSKDMILEAALSSGQLWIYVLAVLTVGLTAFYTVRMLGLTFFGNKSKNLVRIESEGGRFHEPSKAMWLPYTALAAATVILGIAGLPLRDHLEGLMHHFLSSAINLHGEGSLAAASLPSSPAIIWASSIGMLLVGSIPAYLLYIRQKKRITVVKEGTGLGAVWRFLSNRWYINRLFYTMFVSASLGLGRGLSNMFESNVIDGFNRLLSNGVQRFCGWFRKSHTGILTDNLIGIIIGFTVIILLLFRFAVR